MKQDEIFEQERDILFQTDDEERQRELSDNESESFADSSTSYVLSRNNSKFDQWPQSYKNSVDMLTGITPPTLDSFFNKKQQQSSVLDSFSCSATKQPLLDQDSEVVHNSSVISIKSFLSSHLKLSVPSLSFPEENRNCSFSQSVFNGINILCGTALLTIPYAVKEGGWLGLIVLFCFGIITCYTGILLQRCLESSPGLGTYVDIGQAAFGLSGRIFISILLCLELYGSCVEYIIMMGDNLSGLFPITSFNIAGFVIHSTQIFAVATTLIVLPTVWLRDLSLLSYLSELEVSSLPSCLQFASSGWDPLMELASALPDKLSIYLTYLLQSAFSGLGLQVVTPMMKYALTITPVVLSLEELLPTCRLRKR